MRTGIHTTRRWKYFYVRDFTHEARTIEWRLTWRWTFVCVRCGRLVLSVPTWHRSVITLRSFHRIHRSCACSSPKQTVYTTVF